MTVITIRGTLGSGATPIGRLVADRIHGDYVDREIIAQVAQRLRLEQEQVVAKEEPPSGIWARIAHALERSMAYGSAFDGVYAPVWEVPLDDANYLSTLRSVITELAQHPSIVIKGRGSQFILKGHPAAFHVLVVRPPEFRLQRVMEQMKLGREAAKREMDRYDSSRRTFTKQYFGADREDPIHYDLTISTERLSFEAADQLIVQGAALKQ